MSNDSHESTAARAPYLPNLPPQDYRDIPAELLPLLEEIAESVHDTWTAMRLNEGWRWGPKRSDDDKTNPSILPYKELPESEKVYDRQTAATTLRAIIELGYSIESGKKSITPEPNATTDELSRLTANRQYPTRLIQIWETHSTEVWKSSPACYCTAAELLCRHGEAFSAFDVCREGLAFHPDNPRLRQLEAWALAQGGALTHARQRLSLLCTEPHNGSAESWGLLARTWKDLAFLEADHKKRDAALAEALGTYQKALHCAADQPAAYYPAINCATVCQLLGAEDKAKMYARKAIESATHQHPADPWATATLGEACLLLGDMDQARLYYHSFAAACRHETAVLASARKQARRILDSRHQDSSAIEQLLPLDPVLLIAGQPPMDGTPIQMAVYTLTDSTGVQLVDHILESAGILRLILPLAPDFMPRAILPEPEAVERWRKQGADIIIAHPGAKELNDTVLSYCRLIELGMAKDWAETLVTDWRMFPPPSIPTEQTTPPAAFPEPQAFAFADVAGYGGLDEEQIRTFQTQFIPALHDFLHRQTTPPRFCETWGDALFIGFPDLRSAARLSLELQSFFTRYPWQDHGFDKPLRLRIALHCGPALVVFNPFLGRTTFTGSHVSRAARIEPVADEGQVFCSRAFQLCCRALDINGFTFIYAGEFRLPKNSGREKIYRLVAI